MFGVGKFVSHVQRVLQQLEMLLAARDVENGRRRLRDKNGKFGFLPSQLVQMQNTARLAGIKFLGKFGERSTSDVNVGQIVLVLLDEVDVETRVSISHVGQANLVVQHFGVGAQ